MDEETYNFYQDELRSNYLEQKHEREEHYQD